MKKKLLLSLSFSVYLSFCFSQVNLNAGLVAYYPFNGNANDASGNGNNPIFNNATLTNDRFGNPNGAYYFNGVDNYIEIPNSPSLNPTQISLVAIVKPEGFYYGPCHGNAILNKGDDNNIQSSYLLRFDDNFYTNGQNCTNANIDSLHQNFYGDYGANAVSIPPYIPYVVKDAWYCVAYTYDGTTVKFYVDGALVTSFASNVAYTSNTSDLFFGKLNLATFPYWFNGVIDEIRIYNRALNVQEVNTLCPLCTVQGSFSGDTICSGATASLTFTASSGTSPFNIQYSDGVNTYTQNNVQSGVPFTLPVTPTVATKYFLQFAIDASGCLSSAPFTKDTAIIVENACSLPNCNNWLFLPSQPSAVQVGNLNVAGNQITVEAEINRTQPYTGGPLYAGDVVSKHDNPGDVNYLLRPNSAEITTSTGYYKTPDICEIELNKTYHIAMVYDGAMLKFYRNGFLMSQIAATGNLFQNNWQTRIGYYFNQIFNTNFLGYIDEVRIWNIARTQTQIQAYMNTSLPNPTTQIGLLAYYQFNDLLNKQGNPLWNGILIGPAIINQSNPTCSIFSADSCCPVLTGSLTGDTICSGSQGSLKFTTPDTTGPFSIKYTNGIDTFTQSNVQSGIPFVLTNTSIGVSKYFLLSITDVKGCSSAGPFTNDTATVIITNCSLCTGSLGDPIVNITFGSGNNPGPPLPTAVPGASTTLTYVAVTGNPATPTLEDGQYTITNNVPLRASNPWFSGAFDHTTGNGTGYMAFYNSSELPGEFYHQTVNNLCGSTTYEFAAWIANAVNPAFYAGENPNVTFTIEQTDGTILASYNTGDIPQAATFTWNQYGFYFTTPSTVSTVVLRMINNNSDVTSGLGGNDFAIDDITFRACGPVTTASFNQTLSVDTLKICADTSVTIYGTVSTGYTSPNYLWQLSADSGKTWNDVPNSNALQILVNSSSANTQKNYIYRMMTAEGSNISSPDCRVASNIVLLIINSLPQGKLFGENICIGDNAVLSFTSTGSQPFNIIYNVGANNYTQSNLNNNSTFPTPYQLTDTTTFNLFTVTDANGCIDTINAITAINVNPIPQGGITGSTVCAGDSASIIFTASSGTSPFEVLLSDGTNTNTYYGIISGTAFKILPNFSTGVINLISITDQNGNGCTRTNGFTSSTATINVIPSPQVQFDSIPQVCIDQPPFIINEAKEITGAGGQGIFTGIGVDANGNFSPINAGVGNHKITYTFTSPNGCADSASRDAIVNPLPDVNAGPDIITCIGFPVKLNVTGASSYLWSPSLGLDDATKQNPVAALDTTTTFIVKGTDSSGCFATDTITVSVSTKGIISFQVPNAFTPNGDGVNDCFGIRNWGGDISVQEFKIYNRWGQLIFSTTKSSDCWDGTFKGAKQDPGGYPYIIKATSPCGNITRTGIVLLIR
jgi:gliding motility-associated-like protein